MTQPLMMNLRVLAPVLDGILIGENTSFTSVATDSRHIEAGQLFVAIKGENFDGNAYADRALEDGAAAVLISEIIRDENCDADSLLKSQSALLVKDTRIALGKLASYWRKQFTMPLIAITGSNGKTTVKEMTATILSVAAGCEHVLATAGNFNNDIGMPLTLLKLKPNHQFAVIEMGMNRTGELDYLTRLASPSIAIINNAGTAHIGELGSQQAIAEAKGEIFSGLGKDGIAIINHDDQYADYWKSLNVGRRVVTFGLNSGADISATIAHNADITQINLSTPAGVISFNFNVLGNHNVSNALAACAIAYALDISLADVAAGLSGFGGVAGRLTRREGNNGALVIDDTYNANPDSMRAAIDVLSAQPTKTLMVMGDMGELGADVIKLHAEIGAYAKQAGVKIFYALGDMSYAAVQAFGEHAQHFATLESLTQALNSAMDSHTTVLVKGSRFMAMERVVNNIIKNKISQGAH